jgi:plastocyanin
VKLGRPWAETMYHQRMKPGLQRVRLGAALATALVVLLGGSAWTAQPPYVVSQKDRAFHPGTLTIQHGDTIRIVNDDGDLLHHAYVESDTFNFDSGDQLPGSKTDVVFSVPGTFNVLCGIHPKMKLVVQVK